MLFKETQSAGGGRKQRSDAASSPTRAARSVHTSILDPPLSRTTRSSTRHCQAHPIPSSYTSTSSSPPSPAVQPASAATRNPTDRPQSALGKRKREVREQRADKRQLADSRAVAAGLSPSRDLLNRENLEKLNNETASGVLDDMAEKKRTPSRRSSNAEMNQDTASVSTQKTSLSLSDYRLNSLDRARIVFQHKGIPDHLTHRVNAILQPQLHEEKESVIFSIADSLSNNFPDVLEVASREDDCVELIYQALEAMNRQLFGKTFALRRKADWDPALKPRVHRKSYRYDDPPDSDPHDRPNKRQQTEMSSEMNMPPPPPPPKPDNNSIRNPRPDITIGFLHAVVAAKMVSLGVNKLDAEEMLKDLQYEEELLSSPTLPALHIRFPSMVVEGKSYATGKSMYEAENQAAVSGSCMLVIQDRLVELTERRSPGTYKNKEPLSFSITHEGPVMLLWLHYITSLEEARFYNMHVLRICHATIPSTTREFCMALAGVMGWASTEFLNDIAAQLVLVWKAAQKETAV